MGDDNNAAAGQSNARQSPNFVQRDIGARIAADFIVYLEIS
jgi:hypothetical protein